MVDITHKSNTLRIATAQATVKVSLQSTIDLINENKIPKGNIFEMGKAAGLLAVKKTADLLPDCHPLPIEYTDIAYDIDGLHIHIKITIKTIYKTGVEVEAMHGASVVALTFYDMLKPVDPAVEISTIKLLKKKGGKKSRKKVKKGLNALVVNCAEAVFSGEKIDRATPTLVNKLTDLEVSCSTDDVGPDKDKIIELVQVAQANLIIFIGGSRTTSTLSVPELLEQIVETKLSGVEQQMNRFGQERFTYAMLSNTFAAISKGRVILAVPGSSNGATEAFDAVMPSLLHIFSSL